MSRLMLTELPCRKAKLREVAALWAMISTKQDSAVGSTLGTSDQEMPDGRPIGGKPPATVPTIATPCEPASVRADTAVSRTTATMAPGTTGMKRLKARMITIVASPNAVVVRLAEDSEVIQCHCCSNQLPLPFEIPSTPGICPDSTWMPTPVRNPISTDALRKSPMKPSRNSRATNSSPPQTSAVRPVMASQRGEPGVSPARPRPPSPAASTAAVAESAPTTSSFDEHSSAKIKVGKMIVYSPVTIGVCAIDV